MLQNEETTRPLSASCPAISSLLPTALGAPVPPPLPAGPGLAQPPSSLPCVPSYLPSLLASCMILLVGLPG